VNKVAIGGDNGVIKLAPQHIDGAAGVIVLGLATGKQRPGDGIGDTATGLVLVQRPMIAASAQISGKGWWSDIFRAAARQRNIVAVHANSFRSVRGRTMLAAILDEPFCPRLATPGDEQGRMHG
jgi:hypothetical protein